jgi:hypothetical protein
VSSDPFVYLESELDKLERTNQLTSQRQMEQRGRDVLMAELRENVCFQALLAELFMFIRPDQTTCAISEDSMGAVDRDPSGRISAHNEGMRRVWLKILEMTEISTTNQSVAVRFEEASSNENDT